jgi:Fe2+ transport system protein B
MTGYFRALLKTMRGEKAEIGDLFNAWDAFGQVFLYFIILLVVGLINLIPILGTIVYIVFFFFAYPGLLKVIDGGTGAIDAMKWGFKAFKAAIGNWILVVIVGGIFAGIGGIAIGIGVIVTLPWGYFMILKQYECQKDLTF